MNSSDIHYLYYNRQTTKQRKTTQQLTEVIKPTNALYAQNDSHKWKNTRSIYTNMACTHHNTGTLTQLDAQYARNNSTADQDYENTTHNETADNNVYYDKYYTVIHH